MAGVLCSGNKGNRVSPQLKFNSKLFEANRKPFLGEQWGEKLGAQLYVLKTESQICSGGPEYVILNSLHSGGVSLITAGLLVCTDSKVGIKMAFKRNRQKHPLESVYVCP